MSDDNDTRLAAAEHIQVLGSGAVAWLEEQAEIAEALGDYEAAKTWREIAAAAKVMSSSTPD